MDARRPRQGQPPAAPQTRRSARNAPNPQSGLPPPATTTVDTNPIIVPTHSHQTYPDVPELASGPTQVEIYPHESISGVYRGADFGTVSAPAPKKHAELHLDQTLCQRILEWRTESLQSMSASATVVGKSIQDSEEIIRQLVQDQIAKSIEKSIISVFEAWDTIPEETRARITEKRAVSFSRLKTDDLERMGVECIPDVDAHMVFDEIIADFFAGSEALTEAVDNFWESAKGGKFSWMHDLRVLSKKVSFTTEARSRMLINRFVSALIMIFEEAKNTLLTMPELTLGRSGSHSRPPVIIHNNIATILSGSIDYACFLLDETTLTKELTVNEPVSLMETDAKAMLQEMIKFGRGIMFMEAKKLAGSLGELAGSLSAYVPQVMGEVLAGMVNLSTEEVEPTGMPWCITDGVNWRFGILCRQDEANSNFAWKCFSLSEFTCLYNEPDNIVKVLKTLICWLNTSHEDLVKVFKKEKVSKKQAGRKSKKVLG